MTPLLRSARRSRIVVAAAALAAVASAAGPSPLASAASPVVRQMIAFRDGTTKVGSVRAKSTTTKVGKRRCALASGTPLAALVRVKPPGLLLRDYGRCSSSRSRDSGQLFVVRIGADRNKGAGGWVYKVGNRLATNGAGDASGPFGNRRLKGGAEITWFYCVVAGACQRTLSTSSTVSETEVVVRVRAFDDEGKGVPAAGAAVSVGSAQAVAGEDGYARVPVAAGRHTVRARLDGAIQALPRKVTVP